MKVNGKVIVVTGAGSGMGRELTLELVKRGAIVAAVDMRAETLEETRQLALAAGGKVEAFILDVSDDAKVNALPDQVEAKLGSADALVNNAGIIQPFVMIKDLTVEAAAKVMNVNFHGPLMLTKAFLPGLSPAQRLTFSTCHRWALMPRCPARASTEHPRQPSNSSPRVCVLNF